MRGQSDRCNFIQTFFGSDSEIYQHKSYGLLLVAVGIIELLRRFGQIGHVVWATPLPAFAIIGGLMLSAIGPRSKPQRKNCDGPCDYGYHGGNGGFVQTAVRLVPHSVARTIVQMGITLGRIDHAHRDTVADLFRIIAPVAVHSPA